MRRPCPSLSMFRMPYSLAIHNNPDIKWNPSGFLKSRRQGFTSASEVCHNSGTFTCSHWRVTTLDPEQTRLHRKDFFRGRGWKLCQFFSLSGLCDIITLAGEKQRPPKGENISCQHMKTMSAKWRPYTKDTVKCTSNNYKITKRFFVTDKVIYMRWGKCRGSYYIS